MDQLLIEVNLVMLAPEYSELMQLIKEHGSDELQDYVPEFERIWREYVELE